MNLFWRILFWPFVFCVRLKRIDLPDGGGYYTLRGERVPEYVIAGLMMIYLAFILFTTIVVVIRIVMGSYA